MMSTQDIDHVIFILISTKIYLFYQKFDPKSHVSDVKIIFKKK